jgi:hypothetical protein
MNFQSRSGSYTDASVPGSRIALLRPGGLRRRNEASSWLEEKLEIDASGKKKRHCGLAGGADYELSLDRAVPSRVLGAACPQH